MHNKNSKYIPPRIGFDVQRNLDGPTAKFQAFECLHNKYNIKVGEIGVFKLYHHLDSEATSEKGYGRRIHVRMNNIG